MPILSSIRRVVLPVTKALHIHKAARKVYRWLDAPRRKKHNLAKKSFYAQFVGKDDLCFDVGANLGDRTRVFLALGARVVAIDPQPMCIRVLENEFSSDARVTIVGSALGSEEGTAQLHVPDEAHGAASLNSEWIDTMEKGPRFPGVHWDSTVDVPVTTLDALIDKFGFPRFCKVDVEGFEGEVFRGLSNQIPFVSYEYNEEFVRAAIDVTQQLVQLGYEFFNISVGESMKLCWTEWIDGDAMITHLKELNGSNSESFGDVYASSSREGNGPAVYHVSDSQKKA